MQTHARPSRRPGAPGQVREDEDADAYRDRVVEAIQQGLDDVAAGRVIDDDELTRELDEELGPVA